jgi:hypothetical protein
MRTRDGTALPLSRDLLGFFRQSKHRLSKLLHGAHQKGSGNGDMSSCRVSPCLHFCIHASRASPWRRAEALEANLRPPQVLRKSRHLRELRQMIRR